MRGERGDENGGHPFASLPESDGSRRKLALSAGFDVADYDGIGQGDQGKGGKGEIVNSGIAQGDTAEDGHIGNPVEYAVKDSSELGVEVSNAGQGTIEHIHGAGEEEKNAGIKWAWYFSIGPGLLAADGEEVGSDDGKYGAKNRQNVWGYTGLGELPGDDIAENSDRLGEDFGGR